MELCVAASHFVGGKGSPAPGPDVMDLLGPRAAQAAVSAPKPAKPTKSTVETDLLKAAKHLLK